MGIALAVVFGLGCPGKEGAAPEKKAENPSPSADIKAPSGTGPADADARPTKVDPKPSQGPSVDWSTPEKIQSLKNAPPVREVTPQEARRLEHTLRALVKKGASEDGFPWALAHGLLAFGPDFRTDEDRQAVDAIAAFAAPETVGNREVYRFAKRTKKGLAAESHPNLLVSALVSAGVPLERKLTVGDGKSVKLRRLVQDAEWAFTISNTDKGWNDYAWSGSIFFTVHAPMEQLQTRAGPLALPLLNERALAHLEDEQSFLTRLMDQGRLEGVRKRRQGIYAHSCGGLHMVQAVAQGASKVGSPELVERVRRQLDVVRFRWAAERAIYRQSIAANPNYAPLLLVQELKFFGHALETFALAAGWGIDLNEDDLRFTRRVTADLVRTVEQLQPIYSAQDALRKASEQTYNDLIGDGCHAVRALRLGRPLMFPEAGKP